MLHTNTDQSTFALVPLSAIVSSPTNPRKSFDTDKLDELAATIKASGVHTPILLRYLPPARLQDTFADRRKGEPLPEYEIVAGERRYRASVIAGMATIPALIRAMTDVQALEVQMIENLQRSDLSELEEADGYQQLCDLTGITKEQIAEKISKSRRYVYQRLALLKLQPLAKDALRLKKISYTAALAISQVHDGGLQAKAYAYAQNTDGDGQLVSTRQLEAWMRNNVLLPLNKAPFDIKAPNLHTSAGSCNACPKRTGADPDLFADNAGPDSCCDAPCYHAKANEARLLALDKFKAQGIPVMNTDEADELYMHSGIFLGYSLASQTRNDTQSGKPVTLLDLLGKRGQEAVGLIAIEHPKTKQAQVYADTAKAEAWLEDQGLIVKSEFKGKADKTQGVETLAVLLSRRTLLKLRLDCAAIGEAALMVVDNYKDKALNQLLTPELIYAFAVAHNNEKDELKTHYDHMRVSLRAMLDQTNPGAYSAPERRAVDMAAAASVLKLADQNLEDITGQVTSAELEDYDQQIEALRTKHGSPKPTPPLAQPNKIAKTPPTAKPTPKSKAKLSPKQAQLGIAEAMQKSEEEGANALPSSTFTPGQKVKVLHTDELTLLKYIGSIGKIKKACNGNWDVAFHGKGIAEFQPSELQAV